MAKVAFRTKDGRTVSFNTGNKKKRASSGAKKRKTQARTSPIRKSKKRRRQNPTMAKRKGRRSAASSSGGMMNTILGGAAAGLIADMIPYGNIGKLAVGYVAGKKGGMLGATGKAIAVIGAANFTRQNLGGMVGSQQLTLTADSSESW